MGVEPILGGFVVSIRVKVADIRVKAGEDDGLSEGVFEAYASTFIREPDAYGDIVAPGAFENTLKEWSESGNTLPVLYGHRMDDPDYNIGGVLEAVEDEHGLRVVGQLDVDTAKGAQVYRLLKGRRVSQMSFAYDIVDSGQVTLDDGRKANELRELKLYEVSIVPVGANQDTEILAVKAATGIVADGVKAGRVLSQKNIDSLRKAQEAIGAVIADAESRDDQEKADGHSRVNDEHPRVKSEEPRVNPFADALALEMQLQEDF